MRALLLCAALLLPCAAGAQGLRFVVIHKAGKRWNPDLPMLRQRFIRSNPDPAKSGDTHVAYYAKLLDENKLALGGPMLDAADPVTKKIMIGRQVGMMVSTPDSKLSKEEWQTLADHDPAVKAGVLSAEVREWTVAMEP